MVFRINPFIPIEVIAKVTRDADVVDDILTENSFLKLAYNEDYMCKVYEEVIGYGSKSEEVKGLVAIVECAENDMLKMAQMWVDEEQS